MEKIDEEDERPRGGASWGAIPPATAGAAGAGLVPVLVPVLVRRAKAMEMAAPRVFLRCYGGGCRLKRRMGLSLTRFREVATLTRRSLDFHPVRRSCRGLLLRRCWSP